MISSLFNPGLRTRHWEKMSEIAGQDLTPTEVQQPPCSFTTSLLLLPVGLQSPSVH